MLIAYRLSHSGDAAAAIDAANSSFRDNHIEEVVGEELAHGRHSRNMPRRQGGGSLPKALVGNWRPHGKSFPVPLGPLSIGGDILQTTA